MATASIIGTAMGFDEASCTSAEAVGIQSFARGTIVGRIQNPGCRDSTAIASAVAAD
jgi:hypothetical protein